MVNFSGVEITPDEVISYLKKTIQLREICQQILLQQIINQAAQEREITVSSDEIQAEGDLIRRTNRLERASDTMAWLTGQLITSEDWEAGIRDRLLTQKLMESLFASEVEGFFAQNRLDFDRVLLYAIIVPYEQIAQEVFYQIEEREISFYEAAHLYDISEERRQKCGYEGKLYRRNLRPEITAVVFGANVGEVTRPIQTDQGYHLFLVEEFLTAQLTPEVRQEILQRMFREWLDDQLRYQLQQ